MKENAPVDLSWENSTKRQRREADSYFDLFHGGVHNMSEMGVAAAAAKALVDKGDIHGQHTFDFDENGGVIFDIQLSIPQRVRERELREELRGRISELRGMLPEGPNKR